ncbi:MAG: hypothetical protein SGJ20_20160 [Planctomycetota bacterium]|nr:hypothetical protein [Planctomycetota bacterium]
MNTFDPTNDKLPGEKLAGLEWLAFQYLSDELTPAEALVFEARMETDQAAREALAAAVELQQGALAVLRESRPLIVPSQFPAAETFSPSQARSERGWRRHLSGIFSVAAACAILIVLFQYWQTGKVSELPGGASSPDAAEVAMLWSSLQQQNSASLELDAATQHSATNDVASADINPETISSDFLENDVDPLVTPDWMVIALQPETEQLPSDSN